jgi:hypothetical protein
MVKPSFHVFRLSSNAKNNVAHGVGYWAMSVIIAVAIIVLLVVRGKCAKGA